VRGPYRDRLRAAIVLAAGGRANAAIARELGCASARSASGGAASAERMASIWPTAHLIHLPAHASLLDQAEIYFSVVQRKALTPNDFTGLDQIRDRLAAFERSATTLSLGHLPGSSPAPTSGTCCAGSTCTTKPGPMLWRPDLHHRRTYGPDH
jgi:hypothetical protein